VQCEPLKHRFLDLNQIAIKAGKEAENQFAVPGEQMKHRFIIFTEVAF